MTDILTTVDSPPPRHSWLSRALHTLLWCLPVAALALASLLGYWGRDSWELDSLNHFRLQYVMLAGVLCLALLTCRRPILLTLSTGLLILNTWEVVSIPQRADDTPGPVYKALSINVHTHNHEKERTVELIRSEQPDIVAIVELTHRWKPHLESLRDLYPHQALYLYGNDYGYCLLSRYPFSEEQPRFREYGAMPRRVDTPSGPLIAFMVHPTSPTSAPEWRWRNRIYRHLAEFCQEQQDPILMLGDFNSTPWSPLFRDLVRDSGLRQPGTRLVPRPTWPAGWPLIGIPIDHFLISPGLTALSERVGPNVGSDHYPILLEFTFSLE